MTVRKRNGEKVEFDRKKIVNAILASFKEIDGENSEYSIIKANNIADYVQNLAEKEELEVEKIQDIVEQGLMATKRKDVARAYVRYRYNKELARSTTNLYTDVLDLVEMRNETLIDENSNKNAIVASTQRDYMAGEISKDLTNRLLLPKDIVEAHKRGEIHFHDADYYAQHIFNCCLVNLEDMLQNGTVINKTKIEKPHSFPTACNVATQIVAVVASGQYGGQSISLTDLAPFVDISRQQIIKELKQELSEINISDDKFNDIVEKRLRQEIKKGVQTIQYQINTLNTSNGQTPFVSVFMYLNEAKNEQLKADLALIIEEVLRQRIQGVKNEVGVWIAPTFPKLIYVLEEDNIVENSKYWYLTKLSAECTAKRMVPDYISEKIMKKLKQGDCYPVMGCRSALTPDKSKNGYNNIAHALNYDPNKTKYYGRFNQGVITINLPYVALSAKKQNIDFWVYLDNILELCHRGLQERHKRLEGTTSDISPIHWQHGALARLPKGEKINELLHHGYSTISLGFAGLWECVYALIGEKLTTEDGKALGLKIMKKLNDACAEWKEKEDIDYSPYGTPLESTTYKFAKALKKDFGIIPHVSDKDYITNSYHIHVTEPIDAFSKLKFESEFQALAGGGAISYIEVPNLAKNIPAILEIIKFIYDNIMYAELNTKLDFCEMCNYDGEIEIVKTKEGKLDWRCPQCGNMDHNKMNIVRRTCGYLGSNFWNQGRTEEIAERVLHL